MKKVLFMLLCLLQMFSCSKEENESPIVGTWNEIYVLETIYDLQTEEIIGEHGYSARVIATFYDSGKLMWNMLGTTYEGKYSVSNKTINLEIGSEKESYRIEESSFGKLILSKDEIDQKKQMKEKLIRVFLKTGYQLSEDDIMKYTGPYPEWGVTRGIK